MNQFEILQSAELKELECGFLFRFNVPKSLIFHFSESDRILEIPAEQEAFYFFGMSFILNRVPSAIFLRLGFKEVFVIVKHSILIKKTANFSVVCYLKYHESQVRLHFYAFGLNGKVFMAEVKAEKEKIESFLVDRIDYIPLRYCGVCASAR